MLNRTILIGRTTKDVDFRRTANGTPVVSFTLAVENRFNKDAEGKPTADFISCVAWNKTAETMEKYVKKGMLIAIEGRIQTRNYDDKNGNKVYVTEVIVENMRMLEYKDNNNASTSEQNSNVSNDQDYVINEDDLPF